MTKWQCPFFYFEGMVKKCGMLKIVHDKYKPRRGADCVLKEFVETFENAKRNNKELEALIPKTQVKFFYESD